MIEFFKPLGHVVVTVYLFTLGVSPGFLHDRGRRLFCFQGTLAVRFFHVSLEGAVYSPYLLNS